MPSLSASDSDFHILEISPILDLEGKSFNSRNFMRENKLYPELKRKILMPMINHLSFSS